MQTEHGTQLEIWEEQEVRRIANLVALDHIEALVSGGLLFGDGEADEIREAVGEYRGVLVPLPDSAFDLAYVTQWGPGGQEFMVDVPLWTVEGRSDLVVSCLLRRHGPEPRIVLYDVRIP